MDLKSLYHDLIIHHSKASPYFGTLEHATCTSEGTNPLCGDQLTLYLVLSDQKIQKIRFEGTGCAISMAEHVENKTISEAITLLSAFLNLVTTSHPPAASLGKLEALSGVREFPGRVKCATLAWHALRTALDQVRWR